MHTNHVVKYLAHTENCYYPERWCHMKLGVCVCDYKQMASMHSMQTFAACTEAHGEKENA